MTATVATQEPVARMPLPGRLAADRPALVALLLGVLGVGYRGWLLANHAPFTNSDEATMALAALHVSRGADWPVFFYGQDYMGVLEAYAAAPLFRLFGPSITLLRLPVLVGFALFLWLAYRLTRLVWTPWLAVLVVGLLASGSDRVVKDQLIAAGGYPEVLPLGTGVVLLALLLALGRVRWRLVGFAAWGLLVGLLVWDDWLIAPYLLAGAVLLVAGCGGELLGRPGLAVLGGTLAGALPLLLFNLAHPDRNSLATYLKLSGGGQRPLADRLHGAIGLGIPLATGVCQPSHCGPAEVAYGYGYLALLLVALGMAVLAVRRLRRAARVWDEEALRQFARLCLTGAALLTVALYVRNSSAAGTPIESARYLACLQISLAAGLWPLWVPARAWVTRVRARRAPSDADPRDAVAGIGAAALLAAVAVAMVLASGGVVRQAGATRADHARTTALVAELRKLGVHEVYTEYWSCGKLVFASGERVLCASLEKDMRLAHNRYLPYVRALGAAGNPAYVAPTTGTSGFDEALRAWFAAHGVTPTVVEVPGYRIYRTDGRVGIPVA